MSDNQNLQGTPINTTEGTPVVSVSRDELKREMERVTKEFSDKIEQRESKTIEILAIFITLFTFISVNVNMFTKMADVHTAVWFMILMTVCSLVVLSFMFIVIRLRHDWTLGIPLLLCLVFLVWIAMSSGWNPKLNLNDEPPITLQVVPVVSNHEPIILEESPVAP